MSVDFTEHGYVRAAAVAPVLSLADPETNAERIAEHLRALAADGVSIALFPELCLTGYTCEDLFFDGALARRVRAALLSLAPATEQIVCVVGVPWVTADARLLNCAAVLAGGTVEGLVPKTVQPNYGEFYERRWFASGEGVDELVEDAELGQFWISREQLFQVGAVSFGIEVCEDLWAPDPPGIRHCLGGADLILNPSASNELIGKAEYRRDLVRMASARGICGYLYASAGPLESSKDTVFGGHLLAFENGHPLGESSRFAFTAQTLVAEFDVARLRHDRLQNSTFASARRPPAYHRVETQVAPRPLPSLTRPVDPHPFVPEDEAQFDARAAEILAIQATGLARRLLSIGSDVLVLGVSGGLDSTLAFLVCLDALERLGRAPDALLAVTMPGPGTSPHTLESARRLAAAAGVRLQEIDIRPAVAQHLADLQHEATDDVVFENAQARERTQILFDLGNKHRGLVVGTGDLSELALGWCTYNADHMSGYNVNAGVPKTLVKYLVRWYARHRASAALAEVLGRILETPISPELLAPDEAGITQRTEALIGPYELHDFFLFHYLRGGAAPAKIHDLACLAFAGRYPAAEIRHWLGVFFRRFFAQQFKRTTLPPGPKVGTVSLSPRGDWRMPDEAAVRAVLAELEALEHRASDTSPSGGTER
ncbi:MAG TPA: NAD(+) synthase [Pseudomonadales bacterium]